MCVKKERRLEREGRNTPRLSGWRQAHWAVGDRLPLAHDLHIVQQALRNVKRWFSFDMVAHDSAVWIDDGREKGRGGESGESAAHLGLRDERSDRLASVHSAAAACDRR